MAKGNITDKERQILEYIKQEILKKGFPPSVREIGQAVGLSSTSTVHNHLEKLEIKGYIRRDPAKSRTIEILDEEFYPNRREMVNIPMVGRVAAGEPILAEQNIQSFFPIPVEYAPNNDTFMLKVKGESMVNAGIMNGDYILVEHTNSADNGDVVVALIEDSATVKTYYKEKDYIRLQPENDTMEPIIVPNCDILGKVFGVFRFFNN